MAFLTLCFNTLNVARNPFSRLRFARVGEGKGREVQIHSGDGLCILRFKRIKHWVEKKRKEGKGRERKGKERKGRERKGKERKKYFTI